MADNSRIVRFPRIPAAETQPASRIRAKFEAYDYQKSYNIQRGNALHGERYEIKAALALHRAGRFSSGHQISRWLTRDERATSGLKGDDQKILTAGKETDFTLRPDDGRGWLLVEATTDSKAQRVVAEAAGVCLADRLRSDVTLGLRGIYIVSSKNLTDEKRAEAAQSAIAVFGGTIEPPRGPISQTDIQGMPQNQDCLRYLTKHGYIIEDRSRRYRANPDYHLVETLPKSLDRVLKDIQDAAEFTIVFQHIPEGRSSGDEALKQEVEDLPG